jgi:isoquinoline 1-oxidoreductase beta subunit
VANAFTIETTLDELAALAARSAIDVRLEIIGEPADIPRSPDEPTPYDPSRMARAIREAASRGGFGRRPPEGRARGFAAHFTFGGYCAQVVELSMDDRKRVVIHRITAVVDVGRPVNPLTLEAQVQGGIIDALGSAFFCDVPIGSGRATVTNFNDYRLIRNREAPAAIDVFVVPSTMRPTGIGEIPVPVIAPAVANAIAAGSGERLRQMPFLATGYELGSASA